MYTTLQFIMLSAIYVIYTILQFIMLSAIYVIYTILQFIMLSAIYVIYTILQFIIVMLSVLTLGKKKAGCSFLCMCASSYFCYYTHLKAWTSTLAHNSAECMRACVRTIYPSCLGLNVVYN